MTAAYLIFGNGGKYYEPYTIYRIEDNEGNVIYDYQQREAEQAISFDTATIMNKLLHLPIEGTNGLPTARQVYRSDLDQIGKTGTSEDYNNIWYMGGTPSVMCGIWYGHETLEEVYDTNGAKSMYNGIIDWLEENLLRFPAQRQLYAERQRGAALLLPQQRQAARLRLHGHRDRLVLAGQRAGHLQRRLRPHQRRPRNAVAEPDGQRIAEPVAERVADGFPDAGADGRADTGAHAGADTRTHAGADTGADAHPNTGTHTGAAAGNGSASGGDNRLGWVMPRGCMARGAAQ